MTADDVIATARGFVGTPFHHGGRLPGVGMDCIGVIACAARALGAVHEDVTAYPLRPNGQLRREMDRQLVWVFTAQAGDVLMMSFEDEPHHLALHAGGTIIHAYAQARRVVEQPLTDYWTDKVRGIYRFKELHNG